MKSAKSVDMFRKIPVDLTDSTALGAFFSLCAVFFMLILFMVEFWAFLDAPLDTSVILDSASDAKEQIRINFNITMLEIPCDYASVDVVDVLGTNRLNITKNIEKWHLNAEGLRKMYVGRNREQHDIVVEDHPYDLEELHENGEHAIPVTTANFAEVLADKDFTFVDFYAPWCIWCQRLAPTWELFAEDIEENENLKDRVNIVKVDCVAERELCTEHKIRSFPTLRFFINDSPSMPDYKGDRTRDGLLQHAMRLVKQYSNLDNWPEGSVKQRLERANEKHTSDRAGCMLNGYLTVNKVPGNFHVEARSKYHDLDPTMTNLSHIVNHLSFGQPLLDRHFRAIERVPDKMKQIAPIDGNVYTNDAFHQAYHHYVKVVATSYNLDSPVAAYQFLATSQTVQYDEAEVPEARFAYTISPMGVRVKTSARKWYDFITTVSAIVGGTFTIMGVVDAIFYRLLKKK